MRMRFRQSGPLEDDHGGTNGSQDLSTISLKLYADSMLNDHRKESLVLASAIKYRN